MMLLTTLFALFTQTAQADSWPEYITDVVLAGGTASEVASVKSSSTYSGYTWCSKSLNDGTSGDIIYIGYKTGSRANTNGGYISDFIVVDVEDHNPPSSIYCKGYTYYLCPTAGGDYFANVNKGNLTSQASLGWNIYLYYTKANFSDKRAVSSITIDDIKAGAIHCYRKDGSLREENISLNRGVKNTPYVFMHISTVTKTNRPKTDPVIPSTISSFGSAVNLIETAAVSESGTMYYRLGTSGSYTTDASSIKASTTGTYTVYYYAASNSYGGQSDIHSKTVTVNSKTYNSTLGGYEIRSVSDLRDLSTHVNSGNDCSGMKFVQTCDIDFAPGDSWTTSEANNFNGIGNLQTEFKGTFDGQGYTISGVRRYANISNDYVGLFGCVSENGTVKNVILKESSFVALGLAGGIAGYNEGTIENCYVKNCCVDLRVVGTGGDYGAIIGVDRGGTLRYNYYYKCKVRGTENLTNVGCNRLDIAEDDGATSIWEGQGSYAYYYHIASSSGWELFADNVADGNTFNDKHFSILNDLTVRRSVGTSTYPFEGEFVGKYGYVSPFTITLDINNSSTGQALFSYIKNAEISDLVVAGSVSGGNYSAALVGFASGSNTIKNVHVSAEVTAKSTYCGGIVGNVGTSSTTIKDCVFTGSILGGTHVGVFCGWANSGCSPTIENCFEFGSRYTGTNVNPIGLISSWGTVTNSYYKNSQKGSPSQNTTRGKLAYTVTLANGINVSGAGLTYNGTLYMGAGDVVTLSFTGTAPTEGYASNGFSATAGTVNGNTYTMAAANTTITTSFSDVWGVTRGCNGTAEHPYTITSPKGLDLLALNVNNGNTYSEVHFQLGGNIVYDKNVQNNYTPIGCSGKYFRAHFNGQNYTISGIRISCNNDDEKYKGLFGNIDNGSIVENLHLADIQMCTGGYSGILVGTAYNGLIRNCYVHNDVTLQPAGVYANYLGGLVGQCWDATIENCASGVQMSLPGSSAPNGFGGIVGQLRDGATIRNCLAVGARINSYNSRGVIVGSIDADNYTLQNNYYIDSQVQGATTGIGCKMADVTENDGAVPALRDEADNSTAISLLAALPESFASYDALIQGRTLRKDGQWQTLSLPFDVTLSGSPLDGAEARTLTAATITGNTLNLTFGNAVTSLTAGVPYLIRWKRASDYVDDDAHNIVSPTFSSVRVQNTSVNYWSTGQSIGFLATPSVLPDITAQAMDDYSPLLLGSDNTLHHVDSCENLNAFRAYFLVKGNGFYDIDGNDQMDQEDATALASMLANGTVQTDIADVNGDGQATLADLTALVNCLLGRTPSGTITSIQTNIGLSLVAPNQTQQ